jgi:leucyl-tRNA synthetase
MVSFKVNGHQESISVFTTRPDYFWGNFMTLAQSFGSSNYDCRAKEAVQAYIEKHLNDRRERMADVKTISGCSPGLC